MRVLIATSRAFHLHHLARELLQLGCEVEFHSYIPRFKTREYGLPDRNVHSHFLPLLPRSALAFARSASPRLQPIRDGLSRAVDRRIARTMKPADVFIGMSSMAIESARAARANGALVLIERGSSHILHQLDTARADGATLPSATYVERELRSYEQADRVVLLSQYARDTFAARGFPGDRVEVMPLGVDLSRFYRVAPPPLPVRAMMVGAWTRRKGSDLVAGLLDRIPELCITHIGSPGDVPFPASPRFRTLGHLPQPRIAAIMHGHHLLLFPSRDDGFGMVMAEALACGLRVVASRASGGPDLAQILGEQFVTVVPPGSLDALETATRQQMAAIAARPNDFAVPAAALERLSWHAYGQRYLTMIRSLLENRR